MIDIQTNPIGNAANWLEATLLGSVATVVTVIAVACVGLAMLTGRTDLRRASHVLLGCFMIFGASAIANGLRSSGNGHPGQVTNGGPPAPVATSAAYPAAPATPYDPYAGAALQRQ